MRFLVWQDTDQLNVGIKKMIKAAKSKTGSSYMRLAKNIDVQEQTLYRLMRGEAPHMAFWLVNRVLDGLGYRLAIVRKCDLKNGN